MKAILQVEDDPDDVFLLRHAMNRVGFMNPVQVADDGQQAIDYLRGVGQFADRGKFPLPCLLLLDLKLPCVTGLEVLREIRKRPATPLTVVILTSSEQDADIAAAYRLGANAFVTKPSEATKLQRLVRQDIVREPEVLDGFRHLLTALSSAPGKIFRNFKRSP